MTRPAALLGGGVVRKMVVAASDAVAAEHALLSSLDAVAGDGDHGVNLTRAMEAARSSILAVDEATPGATFRAVADACAEDMGGAAGALFGAFFGGMADAVGDEASVDAQVMAAALSAGAERVRRIGRASVGDRSMVDALVPAADAAKAAWRSGGGPVEVLAAAATAARSGAAATRTMVPAVGRAKYAGRRAVGSPDPGATSLALILSAWARAAGRDQGTSVRMEDDVVARRR